MRGRPADDAWIPRSGSGTGPPTLAFRVLALFLGVMFGLATLFSLAPSAGPSYLVLDRMAAGFYIVMALLTWFVLPRLRNGWGLDVAVYASALGTFLTMTLIPDATSRVLLGYALVLLGVFAAYFLPRTRFIVTYAAMLLTYCGLAALVPPGLPWFYVLAIAFVTSTVAAFVSALITRLRDQALTDQLTGLLNRRGLALLTPYVAAEAARRDTPTAVALIDLDGFKAYNDMHGHLAGDHRLAEVAASLLQQVRGSDIVARFGGDEFAVVLPRTDLSRAREILHRAAPEPGMFSVGVARWQPDEPFDIALARADADLYAAKRR